MMAGRVVWIVLDSLGMGHAPDAAAYGDDDANTLAHVAQAAGGLAIPHMARLGLARAALLDEWMEKEVTGAYGTMTPQSAGKDTTNGHLEMVGVVLREPMPVYPQGFPPRIMEPFERAIGSGTLGNIPASGTEIIKRLGDEHVRTGKPIVYTSGDSVFQLAAHESIVSVERLYEMCRIARELLQGPDAVGRVIARPFAGPSGAYARTANRRDFSLDFGPTLLTALERAGVPVVAIGKIEDIYGGRGIARAVHTSSNQDGVRQILTALGELSAPALLFANLVDFDMLYGHRNDPAGFARAIEAFDDALPDILRRLREDDVLIITADHGCDPTTAGTDHTRESVPLLVFAPWMTRAVALGQRATFADLGATVAEYFGVSQDAGTSFWPLIREALR